MFTRFKQYKTRAVGALALAVALTTVATANAQYSNYFYYRNPRTGQTYTIGGTYGRNGSYSGGFSYASRGRYYSSYSGWGGGNGNRHYWGGSSYGTPRYGYGTRWGW